MNDAPRYIAINLQRCGYFRSDLSWGWGERRRTDSGEEFLRCLACGVSQAAALNYVRDLNALPPGEVHPAPPVPLSDSAPD